MKLTGHIDEITRFLVAGWAADLDDLSASLRIIIVLNGAECTRLNAESFRSGLEKFAPGATGKYAFRYYFDPPLSPYQRNEIEIQVRGSDNKLANGHQVIEPIEARDVTAATGPARPILVSTSGRSGSTVMMGILAEHPQIVVADRRPFEVEMLSYYSYALRTLMAAGDHEQSLRPDRITASENRYRIGFNPFTQANFRAHFQDRALFDRYMNNAAPNRLRVAFRDTILDYYAAVAADTGKPSAIYFAEKSLPEGEVRRGARFLFGTIREVVLIRDVRDSLCSFMKSGKTEFARTLRALESSARRFLEIDAARGPDVHFVRYEDLVREPRQTLAALFEFLGLYPMTHLDPANMTSLFEGHATSRNPAESIGRWRQDLTADQREACGIYDKYLQRFGYDATAASAVADTALPPAPTPVQPEALADVDLAEVELAEAELAEVERAAPAAAATPANTGRRTAERPNRSFGP